MSGLSTEERRVENTPSLKDWDDEPRKFTVHIGRVESVVMTLLGLYGVGAILLGIHLGTPADSNSYYSTVSDAQTVTAWAVGVGGVLTAVFTAMIVDVIARWMKYTLLALLDIRDIASA